MKLNKKGNRLYMDTCWYLVADGNGEFNVYNDGYDYNGHFKDWDAFAEVREMFDL